MILDLRDEKWFKLLKVLSEYKLPLIDGYNLNYVPEDSHEVRNFIMNSIPVQNELWFNHQMQIHLEWSKYFIALKEAAKKVTEHFFLDNISFSVHEFWEFISWAKKVKNVHLESIYIPFDYEGDFGDNMEGWVTKYISFWKWGDRDHSNWENIQIDLKTL